MCKLRQIHIGESQSLLKLPFRDAVSQLSIQMSWLIFILPFGWWILFRRLQITLTGTSCGMVKKTELFEMLPTIWFLMEKRCILFGELYHEYPRSTRT